MVLSCINFARADWTLELHHAKRTHWNHRTATQLSRVSKWAGLNVIIHCAEVMNGHLQNILKVSSGLILVPLSPCYMQRFAGWLSSAIGKWKL